MKIKNEIIKGGIVISIITLLVVPFHLLNKREKNEENKISLNTENLISYTINGEIAKEKPTKDSGYIANKITCKNNSNIVWDNDNWEVEMNSDRIDRCTVDFTKDTTREGYRVTVTSNNTSSLDSISKTTVNGGTVTIYPKGSTIASVTGCNGEVVDNKVIVRNVTENQTCNITVKQSLANVILSKYDNIIERTDFSNIETQAKLWKTTDYNASGSFTGTSYYYTGNPDNWVEFAGALWRIVRINGDGSIRMLYAGNDGISGTIDSRAFNEIYLDPMYVGWKYGTSGSLANNRTNENESTIYSSIKTWYQTNIVNAGLEKYISKSAVYCNDRSLASGSTYSIDKSFYYAGNERFTNKKPTLKCNVNDQFKDGFGLLTMDETLFAGNVVANWNSDTYLCKGSNNENLNINYWLMTPKSSGDPSNFATDNRIFIFWIMCNSSVGSQLNSQRGDLKIGYRPLISLVSSVGFSEGDGSSSNPYKIITN